MKNLKEYIVEGIFDTDEDTIDKNIKDQIKRFLKDNFNGASLCKISNKPNADGKYEVSCSGNIEVKNYKITSLTNNMFIWTAVEGEFDCSWCGSLTSLEGSPKEVGGDFYCNFCDSLKSLEGAPKEVGGGFSCNFCDSLKSLEGAPKEVGGGFSCSYCHLLTSLEGAPKEVCLSFYCEYCDSLTSLKGAPKEVGGNFSCGSCRIAFTTDGVKKVSNIKGMIYI